MEDLTKFLGLPEFDFSNVTSVGRYNVGGNPGYDKATKIDEEGDDNEETVAGNNNNRLLQHEESSSNTDDTDLLAISDALMNELVHFYRPYNERLFQLIGKRCPWK